MGLDFTDANFQTGLWLTAECKEKTRYGCFFVKEPTLEGSDWAFDPMGFLIDWIIYEKLMLVSRKGSKVPTIQAELHSTFIVAYMPIN